MQHHPATRPMRCSRRGRQTTSHHGCPASPRHTLLPRLTRPQALDLSKQQEVTKAQELKTEEAKNQAAAAAAAAVRALKTLAAGACFSSHLEQRPGVHGGVGTIFRRQRQWRSRAEAAALDICSGHGSSWGACSTRLLPRSAKLGATGRRHQVFSPQLRTQPPCAAAAQEQERVRWESQSKFAQEEAQRKAQLAQYQDELARK